MSESGSEHAERAEYAGEAEHAEFAEFAEHAEFAEYAEHAAHAEHELPPLAGEDEHVHARPGAGPGHPPPAGTADQWPREMLHLVDHAAARLQQASRIRIRRQDQPESRWPVTAAV